MIEECVICGEELPKHEETVCTSCELNTPKSFDTMTDEDFINAIELPIALT